MIDVIKWRDNEAFLRFALEGFVVMSTYSNVSACPLEMRAKRRNFELQCD